MLKHYVYNHCRRLYWQPEDTARESELAVFWYNGQRHRLEFDGKVDDVILESRRHPGKIVEDVTSLESHLLELEKVRARMDAGERVEFSGLAGQRWTARLLGKAGGIATYLLAARNGQFAALQADIKGGIKRLLLRTRAQGITHEIKAQRNEEGKLVCTAEAVNVYKPRI